MSDTQKVSREMVERVAPDESHLRKTCRASDLSALCSLATAVLDAREALETAVELLGEADQEFPGVGYDSEAVALQTVLSLIATTTDPPEHGGTA